MASEAGTDLQASADSAETSLPNAGDLKLPSIPKPPGIGPRTSSDRTAVERPLPLSPGNTGGAEDSEQPDNAFMSEGETHSADAAEIAAAKQSLTPVAIPDAPVEPAETAEVWTQDDYRTPRLPEISYWDLPESVRQEFPRPRMTVLVYAERPEDRFILVDGRRLVEGDRSSNGLELKEIRRDGAVFSYRKYRFVVAR